MQRIYMDANATTPLLPEVFDAMRPFWTEHFGNASSIHQPGQQARAAIDHARDSVASLLNCRASEIVFTSGGTESDNLAIFGALDHASQSLPAGAPVHLITSATEHHAVLHAFEALAKTGCTPSGRPVEVTFLTCNSQGLIEAQTLLSALRPNTRLVSIIYANNETGVIQPIPALSAIAHTHGSLFHTDAVQSAGKLPLNLNSNGFLSAVDLLSLSGHKIYAPKGTGVLFVRRNIRISPLFHGGSHERQRRAGTENVPGIVALGKAAELAQSWLSGTTANPSGPSLDHQPGTTPATPAQASGPSVLAALRDRIEQGLLAQIPDSGVNGSGLDRVCNTTNLFFDHIEAEALVIALDLKGISVSGGSACQSGATEPSHVLTAMGLTTARARASIRISLSRLTTAAEIDAALEIIPAALARLRTLSPTFRRAVPVPA